MARQSPSSTPDGASSVLPGETFAGTNPPRVRSGGSAGGGLRRQAGVAALAWLQDDRVPRRSRRGCRGLWRWRRRAASAWVAVASPPRARGAWSHQPRSHDARRLGVAHIVVDEQRGRTDVARLEHLFLVESVAGVHDAQRSQAHERTQRREIVRRAQPDEPDGDRQREGRRPMRDRVEVPALDGAAEPTQLQPELSARRRDPSRSDSSSRYCPAGSDHRARWRSGIGVRSSRGSGPAEKCIIEATCVASTTRNGLKTMPTGRRLASKAAQEMALGALREVAIGIAPRPETHGTATIDAPRAIVAAANATNPAQSVLGRSVKSAVTIANAGGECHQPQRRLSTLASPGGCATNDGATAASGQVGDHHQKARRAISLADEEQPLLRHARVTTIDHAGRNEQPAGRANRLAIARSLVEPRDRHVEQQQRGDQRPPRGTHAAPPLVKRADRYEERGDDDGDFRRPAVAAGRASRASTAVQPARIRAPGPSRQRRTPGRRRDPGPPADRYAEPHRLLRSVRGGRRPFAPDGLKNASHSTRLTRGATARAQGAKRDARVTSARRTRVGRSPARPRTVAIATYLLLNHGSVASATPHQNASRARAGLVSRRVTSPKATSVPAAAGTSG